MDLISKNNYLNNYDFLCFNLLYWTGLYQDHDIWHLLVFLLCGAFSEFSQACGLEGFIEIVHDLKLLTFAARTSFLKFSQFRIRPLCTMRLLEEWVLEELGCDALFIVNNIYIFFEFSSKYTPPFTSSSMVSLRLVFSFYYMICINYFFQFCYLPSPIRFLFH